ncbi:mitochondrial inner membrane protein-domain-containing protein [Zychaea mexicana]|uniref:mitochondrial inner membrane protein-domain-containing protein n=1 Tax=Zychaea mexicana TaxID=64656 RepID=UPI0022FEB2E2|nr:mitochondrial inner membrane protein-domain-containing protein [Zychaea mexicana]KAI9484897.1 mitochondrial inner membrane protein-domain-containing protein [Zychaea mexicana]
MLASALTRAGTRAASRPAARASRHYATEAAKPKKGSLGKKLVWTTALAGTVYAGATYEALNNEAFYDTYTTYVPGGEQLLDAIEDAMHDKDVKENFDKAIAMKQKAQKYSVTLKEYAVKAKDTSMDLYEYASDTVAQLTGGDKDSENTTPATAGSGPAPTVRKTKRMGRRGSIFANIIETDEAAAVPQFATVGEPAIDELAKTVQELVKMLNDAGLKGHAKRLADYGTHEIERLQNDYHHVQTEQDRVLKDSAALTQAASDVEKHIEGHTDEIDNKVKSARQRSRDRVIEKENKMKGDFAAEALDLQKEMNAIATQELGQQRDAFLGKLSAELKERATEIQRQYVREVRQQVETERGGRLSRVDEVAVRQRVFEKLSYANAESLDDARKAHQLTIAVDALGRAAYAGNQEAFLDELQALLTISAPASPFADITERRNDELVQVIASNISETVARHGIDSMAQMVTRFANVATEVRRASLIPEEGSSMISHIISIIMSKLMFKKEGLVPGDDLEARLARAEYYLHKENDLESATREVNQLKGWPKHLAADWLDAARRHLEIKQALEIMRTQAMLGSMQQL